MSNWKELFDTDGFVEEDVKDQLEEPAKYHVFLLNDDYTPMDFVVDILCNFFNKSEEQATDIMLTIHYKGKGLCGTYTAEIAETKVENVVQYALENQHPLKCVMEKA
ncbi:ATP-dependent Clp protease adapter ClpS [Colwellia sp. E2M01]|uniref:ATP-dependent Clp protease adapter ClpS n=1 Tax=Colwellia sp. E2M01 TaxID=2841561 RepID=UPI001C086C86|nr:ATP-dependent Clp protease adapter ClpS [Colwellia sp. E2M01]MBU2871305.1 ATP-dependent Clp protease adapter ClpS [Colwellia sp. E2M01]